MKSTLIPVINDILDAHQLIHPYIHKTPVLTSTLLNQLSGANLFFKCENLQKSGAFKFRGATHTLLRLKQSKPVKLVTTHSSGNHAGALAKASAMLGVKCIVVMPENAPNVKIEAVKNYGAEIRFCKPTLKAREETTKKVIADTGADLIHPYDNYNIIAGQGTAALELIREVPDLDIIIAPVGGGGLLSGTAIASKSINPGIMVLASEPKGADDAYRSFKSGNLIPSVNPDTIADGLLTSLSERTFTAIRKYVDDIYTVDDDDIIDAMKLIWQYLKTVVEPSAAVTLALVNKHSREFKSQKIGLILSGGNIDPNHLPFH